MKKLFILSAIAGAIYFGSAYVVREQSIAILEQGCKAGEQAGADPTTCQCFIGILQEEMPLHTFWISPFGSDLGTGRVERAAKRAKQECR